jgi:hypothetical protein
MQGSCGRRIPGPVGKGEKGITDVRREATRLFGLFRLSGLFRAVGPMNEINQTNQMNQTNQIDAQELMADS